MPHKIPVASLLVLHILVISSLCVGQLKNYTQLNQHLELLSPQFIQQFNAEFTYSNILELSDDQKGEYLAMLGKMYLYNMSGIQSLKYQHQVYQYESRSNYLLGYFYLKMAAQKYENANAYYYLGVLEYMKITPSLLIKSNLKRIVKSLESNQSDAENIVHELSKRYGSMESKTRSLIEVIEDVIFNMETIHLHNTEHNMFLASLYGQVPAQLSLAHMFKNGISTDKNCSTALSYYLSVIKSTKIDIFEFPSEYSDTHNFEKQLYSKKKANLQKYGEYDISILLETEIFDEETFDQYEDIAMSLLTGDNGFVINETLAFKMFQKIQQSSRYARIMLGFMLLRGRGGQKNPHRARALFEREGNESKVAKQTLLVMKYFDMGFKNERKAAKIQMQRLFLLHTNSTILNGTIEYQKQKSPFRTPMLKYLVGSLVIGGEIEGDKKIAILLLDEAAKQGNTLALIQMGLVMLDGSDSSFDCEKSAEYFSKQALSFRTFQQRIELAKVAIKKQKYMFAFLKYAQLMIVGYRNAFINAMYMVEVYGNEVFGFDQKSWSIAQANKNQVYLLLLRNKIVGRLEDEILSTFAPTSPHIFYSKDMQSLTTVASSDLDQDLPIQLKDYIEYINVKITEIGIQKHDIPILRFFKYKKSKDIQILHTLANTGQNSDHIYQSRFLLGQYYQHTNIPGSSYEARMRRAKEEYNRATKNKLLADIIFFIEGGEVVETQTIKSHVLWYLMGIIIVWIYLHYKKNKVFEERYKLEKEKQQEEQNQKVEEGERKRQGFKQLREKNEEREYKGPKFSEQEEENLKNSHDLRKIGQMMEKEGINQENIIRGHSERVQKDKDQPQIIEDSQEQKMKVHHQ